MVLAFAFALALDQICFWESGLLTPSNGKKTLRYTCVLDMTFQMKMWILTKWQVMPTTALERAFIHEATNSVVSSNLENPNFHATRCAYWKVENDSKLLFFFYFRQISYV